MRLLSLLLFARAWEVSTGPVVASTPPRGWNSYDSFTWVVNETQFLDNCQYMADNLLHLGFKYYLGGYAADFCPFMHLFLCTLVVTGLSLGLNQVTSLVLQTKGTVQLQCSFTRSLICLDTALFTESEWHLLKNAFLLTHIYTHTINVLLTTTMAIAVNIGCLSSQTMICQASLSQTRRRLGPRLPTRRSRIDT